MDDRERLTNEMNQSYELLENIICELPVTVARQDELLSYASRLKEASYQAGLADGKAALN